MLALLFALTLQTGDSTAAELLARGEKLLAELEYDAAAAELMRAAAAPDANEAERLKAHLLAGIANRVAGRDTEARLNFRNVLLAAPDTHLPEATSPKVLSFFEAVRQEVDAERASRPNAAITSADASAPAPLKSEAGEPANARTPPPDPRPTAGSWPFLIAGAGATVTVGTGLLFTYTFLDGGVKRDRVRAALAVYEEEPSSENRRALVERTRDYDAAQGTHNCGVVPLACLCVPAGLAAVVGGAGWGIYDGVAE